MLKLQSKNENDKEKLICSVGNKEIKSQSQKLVKITDGLCENSLTLYRDFNGLMRSFYQEKFKEVNKVRVRDSPSVRKMCPSQLEVGEDRIEDDSINSPQKPTNISERYEVAKINVVQKSQDLKKKKRKRVIVWNAWVIDTSSESSSDSESD